MKMKVILGSFFVSAFLVVGCGLTSSTITSLGEDLPSVPIFLFPINSNFSSIIGNGTSSSVFFNGSILRTESVDDTTIRINKFISTSGLLAHWEFDETSFINGSSLGDSSGAGHSGTVITDNGATNKFSIAPKIENAMDLDGVGDYITVPHSVSLTPVNELSVVAWVKVNSGGFATDNGIVCKGPTDWNLNSYQLAVENSTGFSFRVLTSSGMGRLDSGSSVVGKWVHLVGTYDGTTIRLYLDGIESGSLAHTGTIVANTDLLMIGKRCGTDTRHFNGTLDDISIFSRALAANEIEALYEGQNPDYQYQSVPSLRSPVFSNSPNVINLRPNVWGPYGKAMIDSGNEAGNYVSHMMDSSGLSAHWRLDEASISNGATLSESLMANDGTFSGSLVNRAIVGRHNGGVSFDGVADLISVPNGTEVAPSAPSLSYGAWVYLEANGQGAASRVISKGDGGTGDDYALRIGPDNEVSCRLTNDSAVLTTADSNYRLELNQWYYLSCSYDGSYLRVYVNGILTTQRTKTGNIQQSGQPLVFGSHSSSPSGRRLQGRVDDITIWSRVLSDTEMRSMYQRGAMNIKYRVRYCNSADCAGVSFSGPDGTAGSYFSEESSTGTGQPDFDLTLLPYTRPYFQYEVTFESIDSTMTPILVDLDLVGAP